MSRSRDGQRAPRSVRRSALAQQGELAQAEALIASGRGALARMLLTALLDDAAPDPRVHRLLAIEALERPPSADREAAQRDATLHAQRLVLMNPRDAFAHLLRGRAFKAAGDLPSAEGSYREAIAVDPALAEAHVSLGIVLKLRGDLEGAISSYRRALAVAPQMASAHTNLGIALARLIDISPGAPDGSSAEALAAHERAVANDPNDGGARHNLGIALAQAGRLGEAIEQLDAALALDPRRLDSCLALHSALARSRMDVAARECCERWLGLNLPHLEVLNRLFTSLLALGDLEAAAARLDELQAVGRDVPEVLHNLAHYHQRCLDVPAALEHLRRGVQLAPGYQPGWQTLLMCMNYVDEDPRTIAAEHRRFGTHHGAPSGASRPSRSSTARRRIGWLSGDLRRHSVAYFLEPLFEHRDRHSHDWIAYSTGDDADEVSERLRSRSDGWVEASRLSDEALVRRVRDDGIDLLIDLAGHTAGGRPAVFTRLAAPLQLSYLGYPTTSGLPCIDFRISDRVIDPPEEVDLSVESLLHMPGGMFCYRPDVAHEVDPLPALARGRITFGSFNNLAKLSAATLDLWAEVLNAVPGSRLLLKAQPLSSPRVRQRVEQAFEQRGVARDRLLLNPWRPDLASHVELYRKVDIALDTYPYNGATTTCEALWMGVPVLSLRGPTHVSRMGASILTSAGQTDWIAETRSGFVAQAVRRAADLDALAALRKGLRPQLQRSRLLDGARAAGELEALLDRALDRQPAAADAT